MEQRAGFLGRIAENLASWIALALLVLLGVAIWRMDPATRGAIWAGFWKSLLWIGIAAALPWSARFYIGRILELGTNWAGAALLAGLTLVNVIAGLILIGGLPAGGWGWFAALSAAAVAGSYNYLVTEYLAERAGG